VAQLARQFIPADASRERFICLALDTQNRCTHATTISVGLLNSSLVHPREVFSFAMLSCAASVILAHNHPSGDPDPSPEDLEVTWQLVEAGRIVGIPVRDHVILGGDSHVSLLAQGVVPNAAQIRARSGGHER
jgi:DNA repair protein RadC